MLTRRCRPYPPWRWDGGQPCPRGGLLEDHVRQHAQFLGLLRPDIAEHVQEVFIQHGGLSGSIFPVATTLPSSSN